MVLFMNTRSEPGKKYEGGLGCVKPIANVGEYSKSTRSSEQGAKQDFEVHRLDKPAKIKLNGDLITDNTELLCAWKNRFEALGQSRKNADEVIITADRRVNDLGKLQEQEGNFRHCLPHLRK